MISIFPLSILMIFFESFQSTTMLPINEYQGGLNGRIYVSMLTKPIFGSQGCSPTFLSRDQVKHCPKSDIIQP